MTPARQPTILLVDDEPYILSALGRGLERGLRGSRVLTATSGRAGLDILAAEPVDIIISDNMMPGMDGVEFLVEAKRISPRATRMMLTGHADEKLIERNVNDAHVRHFFRKPYSLAQIVTSVTGVIERQQERAESALKLARAIEANRRASHLTSHASVRQPDDTESRWCKP